MTQHIQLRVSTADSAEQRHELSHNHREGSEEGVPQATHLHRPQTTQMMDSEPGERPLGELVSVEPALVSKCLVSREWGGEVITDADTGATVMGLCLCEALRPA